MATNKQHIRLPESAPAGPPQPRIAHRPRNGPMDYEGPRGPARSTQASPARPSTAQISPEMDRWTVEDQGRPGSPTQATVLAQLGPAQLEQLQPSSNSTPAQIGPCVDRWTKVDQRGPGCIQPNVCLCENVRWLTECAVAYSMSGSFGNVQ